MGKNITSLITQELRHEVPRASSSVASLLNLLVLSILAAGRYW